MEELGEEERRSTFFFGRIPSLAGRQLGSVKIRVKDDGKEGVGRDTYMRRFWPSRVLLDYRPRLSQRLQRGFDGPWGSC